jgi:hypothetical protein
VIYGHLFEEYVSRPSAYIEKEKFLRFYGQAFRGYIAWIEAVRMERVSGNFALKVHMEELNNIRKIVADITHVMRILANSEEYRQNVDLLKTVPGISTLTAMTLLQSCMRSGVSRISTNSTAMSALSLIPIPAGRQT